ncbi:MAG: P-II family nitrogen regulator [Clostridiales bacterium]|nr:P-II family nitrogen regulator [Clostridiales bacterium]
MAGYSLIRCVLNMGDASKALSYAQNYGIRGASVSIGRGTVNSRLLDFFALNEVRKEILTMVVESDLASEALKRIAEDMNFEKPNHGIAFSYTISEFRGAKNTSEIVRKGEGMYKIIYVIVDKGKAEDVLDAAREAGSRGGTIINARGAGIRDIQKVFSFEIEPEKEKVFIITKAEQKDAIVDSIRKHMQIDEPGKGILYVVDIDEVYGLH